MASDNGMNLRENGMMKLRALAPVKYALKLAAPGCLAFSILTSLLSSCMACPTCTLAMAKHSEKPDTTPLALLALLGTGSGNKKIWLTGTAYTGALGGISGADAKCNNAGDANWPGSGGYKAMLVDGSNRVACTTGNGSTACTSGTAGQNDWVLQPNTTYVRGDGVTVIFTADANGLWDFANQWPNSITPTSSNPQAWTGLNADWTLATAGCTGNCHCNGWAYTGTSYWGQQGVSSGYSSITISYSSEYNISVYPSTCDNSGTYLYCVEQ